MARPHSLCYLLIDMPYPFTASISQEGKWYVAHAVEFGVVSQGRTIPDAQKNLQEAVELFLEDEPRLRKLASRRAPLLTVLEAHV